MIITVERAYYDPGTEGCILAGTACGEAEGDCRKCFMPLLREDVALDALEARIEAATITSKKGLR